MLDTDGPRVLPRGRHQLTREQVEASQRRRILEAMARTVAERGYAHTAVAQVIAVAGVSRHTFYEQFADKEDCFVAAYDACVELLLDVMRDAVGASRRPALARFDSALTAYLDALAAEPALARTFLIEVYAAGPRVLERRHAVQQRFVKVVAELFGVESGRAQVGRFACEALVAAVSSMVTTRIAAGAYAEVPKLRGPILELVERHLSVSSTRETED